MKEYRISQVQRRDEWASQYGPMVTYAIAVDGESGWVKLNQKFDTPAPQVGDTITGEILNAKDPKGNAYRKFKKINPAYQNEASTQSSGNSDQLRYITQMLEELTGRREVGDIGPKQPPITEDPFAGLDI